MRNIRELVIHCTATQIRWMEYHSVADKVTEITRWHKAKRWRTIGYHRIIDRDGSVGMGRKYSEQGAHVAGHNETSIGVALVGGKNSVRGGKFSDNYTEAQRKALLALIAEIKAEFGDLKITGHNEYSSKSCPGFNVPAFLREKPPHKRFGFIAFILKLLGIGK